MKRKTWIALFLLTGFLGSTYIAISETSLAPFMVKKCTSISVGKTARCNRETIEPLTLQDVERCVQRIQFPLGSTPPENATAEDPVWRFACQFKDMDCLAEGVLARNAEEKLWDGHQLFHVIERSKRCSPGKIDQLSSTYCTCSH